MKKLLLIVLLIVGCDNNSQESTTNWKCMPEGIDTLTVSDDWYISTTYSYYDYFLDKEYLLIDTTLFNGSWTTEEECDIAGCGDDSLYVSEGSLSSLPILSFVGDSLYEAFIDKMFSNLPVAWYCTTYMPRSRRGYCVPKKGTCIESND